jgi:exoribonuclease-2
VLTDLAAGRRSNRARERIEDFMIAARRRHRKVSRVAAATRRFVASFARPSDGRDSSALPGGAGREPSPGLGRRRSSMQFSSYVASRQADPVRFPASSLADPSSSRQRRVRARTPDGASEGHFGLAVRDYSPRDAPNRRYPDLIVQRLLKAALVGDRTRIRTMSSPRSRNTAPSRRTTRRRSSGTCASPRRRCCSNANRRAVRCDRDRAPRRRGRGCASTAPRSKGRSCGASRGSTSATMVKVELLHTDAARGYIDFARVREPR